MRQMRSYSGQLMAPEVPTTPENGGEGEAQFNWDLTSRGGGAHRGGWGGTVSPKSSEGGACCCSGVVKGVVGEGGGRGVLSVDERAWRGKGVPAVLRPFYRCGGRAVTRNGNEGGGGVGGAA
jgi:hypothetical protein